MVPAVKSLSTSTAWLLQWPADPWPSCSGTIDEWGGSSVWVMQERGLCWCVCVCTCVCRWLRRLSECVLVQGNVRALACIRMDLCVTVHSDCKKKEQRVTRSPLLVFYWWDFSAVVLPGNFKIDYRNSWGGLFSLKATYLALTSQVS